MKINNYQNNTKKVIVNRYANQPSVWALYCRFPAIGAGAILRPQATLRIVVDILNRDARHA